LGRTAGFGAAGGKIAVKKSGKKTQKLGDEATARFRGGKGGQITMPPEVKNYFPTGPRGAEQGPEPSLLRGKKNFVEKKVTRRGGKGRSSSKGGGGWVGFVRI